MSLDKDVLARHEVRLFPSVRISSGREAELRATASLLAIAKAVSEFGRKDRRNGTYTRRLLTSLGQIDVAMPRTRGEWVAQRGGGPLPAPHRRD